ncbi:hypothetical protein SEA_CLOWN_87 [Gordonia phage Clown]|uniref:Uncharacterized protein n=1 Tax=Gordonia phage Clown TaxID=2759393 RepID=A0A7L7SU97_9CAUD|nr:hypothetical protein KNV25_gp87 [Gordonia phage Clown]QOC56085.1 hypothetical protein SEA_CLOWN_87 [Gordonia phage Clown]
MRCSGSGRWHVGHAPVHTPHQITRGYCPECGRHHALTRDGRLYRHNAPGPPIRE